MLSLRDNLLWEDLSISEVSQIRQRKVDWQKKPVLLCGAFQFSCCQWLYEIHNLIHQLEVNERPNHEHIFNLLLDAIKEISPKGVHISYTNPKLTEQYVSCRDFRIIQFYVLRTRYLTRFAKKWLRRTSLNFAKRYAL
jgi:hypothetical protein